MKLQIKDGRDGMAEAGFAVPFAVVRGDSPGIVPHEILFQKLLHNRHLHAIIGNGLFGRRSVRRP